MYIFLDIDGVLNTYNEHPSNKRRIHSANLIMLKKLIDQTQAKIILISNWKFVPTALKECKLALKSCHLHLDGMTKDDMVHRGQGIIDYLHSHKVQHYVILDDDDFSDYNNELSKHLVLVDARYGLRPSDIQKAMKILIDEVPA